MSRLINLGVAAALSLAWASPAFAHVNLLRSSPAANATLQTAPQEITLRFDRRLGAASSFELTMPEHGMKVPVRTAVASDGMRLIGTPEKPLAKGAYKLAWTVAGADGHKIKGEFAFRIG